MKVERAQQIFQECIDFAGNFMRLPANFSLTTEDYSQERFGNPLASAVAHDSDVIFNRIWIESGEDDNLDDVRFFCFHELRHVYQRDQIRRLENGENISESIDEIRIWQNEFRCYITNFGDAVSQAKNINQEVEKDANGYAYALLNMFHLKEMDWKCRIRWPYEVSRIANTRSKIYYSSRPEFKRYVDAYQREKTGHNPVGKRPERNDKCPCGSGKKFKYCCLGSGIYD